MSSSRCVAELSAYGIQPEQLPGDTELHSTQILEGLIPAIPFHGTLVSTLSFSALKEG